LHYNCALSANNDDFEYEIYLSGEEDEKSATYTFSKCPVYATQEVKCEENTSVKLGIKLNHKRDCNFPDGSNFGSDFKIEYIMESTGDYEGNFPVDGIINVTGEQDICYMCTTNKLIPKGGLVGHATAVLVYAKEEENYAQFDEPFQIVNKSNIPMPNRMENISMEDTPIELKCSPTARLYPPIDMDEWRLQRDLETRNKVNLDPHPSKFTKERIKKDADINTAILSDNEIERVHEMLLYYQQAFNRDKLDISLGLVGEATLTKTETAPSQLKCKYRKIPKDMQKVIYETIKAQKEMGLLESCSGPYSSAVHVVYKTLKDKERTRKSRLVVDFRQMNEKCILANSKYLNACMNMLQNIKADAKFFTTMDLTSAFYAVSLTPNCRDLTGISVENELLRYTALPFGLSVSSQ
jgi:hypothetical protein